MGAQTKLIHGGTRVEDTEEFKEAMLRERARLEHEQLSRVAEIEADRQRLAEEKAMFEQERKQFNLKTAAAMSVQARGPCVCVWGGGSLRPAGRGRPVDGGTRTGTRGAMDSLSHTETMKGQGWHKEGRRGPQRTSSRG